MARDYRVWLFGMLKGGVRKTTSTMFTAFELAARNPGVDVLVVDADPGTQGGSEWGTRVYAAGGELPCHFAQWTHGLGLLAPYVADQVKRTGARRVLVDVGGELDQVLGQAASIADRVIVPVGPEAAELARVEPTWSVLAKFNRTPVAGVLLNKVPRVREGSSVAARDALVAAGYQVYDTEIPRLMDPYVTAFGTVPTDRGAYVQLVDELLRLDRAELRDQAAGKLREVA